MIETPESNALQVQHHSMEDVHIFFHPDLGNASIAFTVGPGVSPGQPLARVADFTASGEFHPALKTFYSVVLTIL